METWATFSIVDHRKPIYRQALALFDGIVVPIPPRPIGDQTNEELDRLQLEVEELAEHGAAKLFPWDSSDFVEWRTPLLAEALASGISRDAFVDTRLMVAEKFARDGVVAVPVYGGTAQYEANRRSLAQIEEALTVELLQRLPVPDYDTPLEDLIRLRNDPAFRSALADMLEWKRNRVLAIINEVEAERPRAVVDAMRQFDEFTKRYAVAMEAQGHKKLGTVASIFFTACTGEIVSAVKDGLVSFREFREPCWKSLSEMKCSPGGVVYHFEEALR